ncbi:MULTISPECIES: DEAD/DEAH box helicase [Rhodococcus erythropolis group]|nr:MULTISPECIES: DEAD/DEAH box helicase [Rhodococcus erythropolis group]QXC46684.1 Helicase associated domain protein [Rhodococcus qingshengii]
MARPHQTEAIRAALEGFSSAPRGTVVMACGTGKTLVGQRVAEALISGGDDPRVLVTFPSIQLLDQTLRSWRRDALRPFDALAFCSDSTVGSDDISAAELTVPVTTDPEVLARWFDERTGSVKVLFSTYQSTPSVAESHRDFGMAPWDVVIADEAHRCAGESDKAFGTVLSDARIPAVKRLFLTATPRVHSAVRRGAPTLVSMNDISLFGVRLHTLTFGEAIGRGLLSDYHVAVIGVSDFEAHKLVLDNPVVDVSSLDRLDASHVAIQVAVAQAAREFDLRRIIVFHNRIRSSKSFTKALPATVDCLSEDRRPSVPLRAEHIDGSANASRRREVAERLAATRAEAWTVISNVRCLSEGVDFPALDGIVFAEPRTSQIEVAQAVGRAIRLNPDRESASLIVLPVYVAPEESAESVVAGSAYKHVYQTLTALADHDNELAVQLRHARRELGNGERPKLPDRVSVVMHGAADSTFYEAFSARMIRMTTSSWDEVMSILLRYVSETGTSLVPKGTRFGGMDLGGWVAQRRKNYRKGQLSPRRIAELESLPGWVWDVLEVEWTKMLGVLERYGAEHGTTSFTRKKVEGTNLAYWVGHQRRDYRAGIMSPDRIAALENIPGWTWEPASAAWEQAMMLLRRYVGEHGSAKTPKNAVLDDFQLGQWVINRRVEFRAQVLAADRVAELEALPGWTWDPLADQRNAGVAALRAYVAENGTSVVAPGTVVDGVNLSQWVTYRRRDFRVGALPVDLIAELEALPGWTWDPLDDQKNAGMAVLRRYVTEYGTANMPANTVFEGIKLGSWVTDRRKNYRQGQLSPRRIADLEALPGWTWNEAADRWSATFDVLQKYVAEHGSADVPRRAAVDGVRLGQWVSRQRTHRRGGRLSPERVAVLAGLPGWTWDPLADQWSAGLDVLRAYVAENGTSIVASGTLIDDINLNDWITKRRKEFRDQVLAPDRIAELAGLPGWTWDPLADQWSAGLDVLRAYVADNGTSIVASGTMIDGVNLSGWVQNRRRNFREGTLPADRIAELEALPGWTWDPLADQRNAGMVALRKYVEDHGTALVPHNTVVGGMSLGEWVTKQRGAFRLGSLTEKRVAELEALPGWSWDPIADRWTASLDVLRKYLDEHGTAKIPKSAVVDGFNLGMWVKNLRRNFREGKLAPDRIAEVVALPGWTW